MSDLPKVPRKKLDRQPIMRYANNLDQVLAASYLVPKEDAKRLLRAAMEIVAQRYPEEMYDVDFDESVRLSLEVLEEINKLISK